MNKKPQPIGLFEFLILVGVFVISMTVSSGIVNFNIWPKAEEKKADIVIDVKAEGDEVNTLFYHAFAQGGEETADMLSPVLSEIQVLRPNIVRLDHLLNRLIQVKHENNKLVFDYTLLDSMVKTIQNSGAVPMLSLSYMPEIIASQNNILNAPTKWEDWSLVVQNVIEHYSGINNLNIPGIYYEVWNEPDLAQFGSWSITGSKNYLTLYHWAAVGALQAAQTNTFYLGGPVTTGFYPNWIKGLLSSGDRIDFISWHAYMNTPYKYVSDLTSASEILKSFPNFQNTPIIISEFGFTGSRDKRYGSLYAAAHTAAVVSEIIYQPPRYLLSFEIKDGPGQTNGDGWGMIGHEKDEKIRKPRYYIYNFLDMMKGKLIPLTGKGTNVTGFASKDGDIVKIMLVNTGEEEKQSEYVPITIQGLSDGDYHLRQQEFLGKDTSYTINATGSALMQKIYLPAPSVILINIEPK